MSSAGYVRMNPFAVAAHDVLDSLEIVAKFTVDTHNVFYSCCLASGLMPEEKEKKKVDVLPKVFLVMNMCETNYDLMETSILWSLDIVKMSSVWLCYLLCPLQLTSSKIIAVSKKASA